MCITSHLFVRQSVIRSFLTLSVLIIIHIKQITQLTLRVIIHTIEIICFQLIIRHLCLSRR